MCRAVGVGTGIRGETWRCLYLTELEGGFPPELGAMAGQSMAADAGAIAGAERRGQAMGRVADTTASMMSGAMNSPSPAAMPMAKDMID